MLNAGMFLLLTVVMARVVIWLRLLGNPDAQVALGDLPIHGESSEALVSSGAMMAFSSPFMAVEATLFVKIPGFPLIYRRTVASCVSVRFRQRLCKGHRQLSG